MCVFVSRAGSLHLLELRWQCVSMSVCVRVRAGRADASETAPIRCGAFKWRKRSELCNTFSSPLPPLFFTICLYLVFTNAV